MLAPATGAPPGRRRCIQVGRRRCARGALSAAPDSCAGRRPPVGRPTSSSPAGVSAGTSAAGLAAGGATASLNSESDVGETGGGCAKRRGAGLRAPAERRGRNCGLGPGDIIAAAAAAVASDRPVRVGASQAAG